jgi:competence protein ComGF
MAITKFFQELLTKVSKEILRIYNFENQVIRRTSLRTKWYQLLLLGLQKAKVLAILDF